MDNNDNPYIKHSKLGLVLFWTGLAVAILTAMASDSGYFTIYQVLGLAVAESLMIGIGGALRC